MKKIKIVFGLLLVACCVGFASCEGMTEEEAYDLGYGIGSIIGSYM